MRFNIKLIDFMGFCVFLFLAGLFFGMRGYENLKRQPKEEVVETRVLSKCKIKFKNGKYFLECRLKKPRQPDEPYWYFDQFEEPFAKNWKHG